MARLQHDDEHVAERREPEPEPPQADRAAGTPILELQRTAGNAAVARLLAPSPAEETETSQFTFQAVIRRDGGPTAPAAPMGARSDRDAEEGNESSGEVDAGAITDALQASAGPAPDAAEGEKVALPDMRMPASLGALDTDPVQGTITYSGSIAQSGTVSPFGATTWSVFNITNQAVTAVNSAYVATFTLENPITFNVTSPKTSIADENDAALTNANYALASSDLTPDMTRQNGKPPRTKFWARDLTVKHEKFHSDERKRLNGAGATQAQTWLNGQTASSIADVQALIAQVPGRVITASQAAVGTVDEKESRAYGDGAPSYKARADAIKAKGDKGTANGGYP